MYELNHIIGLILIVTGVLMFVIGTRQINKKTDKLDIYDDGETLVDVGGSCGLLGIVIMWPNILLYFVVIVAVLILIALPGKS